MHDIRWIRENPAAFDAAMKARGLEPQAEKLMALDEKRREDIQRLETMQAERNDVARQIGESRSYFARRGWSFSRRQLRVRYVRLFAACINPRRYPHANNRPRVV